VCEVNEGYFPNSEGHAQSCDDDTDGWVNDSAYPRIASTNAWEQDSAKCSLRTVSEVHLTNTDGQVRTLDFSAAPLPLYEGAAIDSRNNTLTLNTGSLASAQLNSLTKACGSGSASDPTSVRGDYNDNAVRDVEEWEQSVLAGPRFATPGLSALYNRYRQLTHFVELHDGWYVAGAETADPGTYVVRERQRGPGVRSVPLTYPEDAGNDYWASCDRHIDSLYDDPEQINKTTFDFASQGEAWGGMLHHSQFRCVAVVSPTDYTTSTREEPYTLMTRGSTLAWKLDGNGEEEHPTWNGFSCAPTGASTVEPGTSTVNPDLPVVLCAPIATYTAGTIRWVSMGYVNANRPPADYIRGCRNECTEIGESECDMYNPDWGVAFVCDNGDATRFGDAVCGCDVPYAGSVTIQEDGVDRVVSTCHIGCGGGVNASGNISSDRALQSGGFDPATRSGTWLCGDFALSSGPAATGGILAGGGFSLRGGVPSDTHSDQELQSSDGFYRIFRSR
jgi:hypothetical protein